MRRIAHILLAGSAMTVAPGVAQAQDAGTTSPDAAAVSGPSGDIVVTARRRAEDVSKVPLAITAFSGEQIQARGIQTTRDLVRITPGLNIQGGSRVNPIIVIRGQGRQSQGNVSSGVITYVNDVPLPNQGSMIPTFDLENVQVLKGPQGTLFGRNALGGAILVVTKAPTHEFGGYVRGELAEYGSTRIEAAVNVPIIPNVVALRLAAQRGYEGASSKTYVFSPYTVSTTGGVTTYTPGQLTPSNHGVDEFLSETYRASLLIEPNDWIKNVTVGEYTKIRGWFGQYFSTRVGTPAYAIQPALTPAVAALAQCPAGTINCNFFAATAAAANAIPDRVNYFTRDPFNSRTIVRGLSNTTTIRLGDNHQIKNIFGYRDVDGYNDVSLGGLAVPFIVIAQSASEKQFTEELQLSGSLFNNDLKYTVGGFLFRSMPGSAGAGLFSESNSFFGLSHTLGVTYLRNGSEAIYGQFDYSLDKFVHGLTLTAGLRQTWDWQSACTLAARYPSSAPELIVNGPDQIKPNTSSEDACKSGVGLVTGQTAQNFAKTHFKKLTWQFGANWQITPDAMVYVTHRRGYRGGGYNTPVIDPYLAAYQQFGPETVTDWEIGAKLRFESGGMRGSLDIAAYTGDDVGTQFALNTANRATALTAPCVVAALGTPGHATSDCTINGVPGAAIIVPGTFVTVNADGRGARLRGIDISASLSPIPELTLTGSLGYIDIKTGTLPLSTAAQNYVNASNPKISTALTIYNQPNWMWNLGATVRYPGEVLGGRLSASIDYHYNGAYIITDLPVPAWHQVDANLELADIADTGLSLGVFVKNLTNETTYPGSSTSATSLGVFAYALGPARTVGANLTYRFGAR